MDDPSHTQRLWTPWRMPYIGGEARSDACIFCQHLATDDDPGALVLHRGEHAFAVMNLFPYNTGHLMIVPNEHAASPEHASDTTLSEIALLTKPVLHALRRVLGCQGFNVGFNVGSIAGAGIAEHLHQHIVPRWSGDANFMPILGSTMVIPELIPVTYAKVRAELEREFTLGLDTVEVVVLDDQDRVLIDIDGHLPRVHAQGGVPLWRTVVLDLRERGVETLVLGWAGSSRADAIATPALTLRATGSAPLNTWIAIDGLEGASAETAKRALRHLAPEVRSTLLSGD